MWWNLIFKPTATLLRDYMVGLALDVGKEHLKSNVSNRKLRKHIQKYISGQRLFYETCSLAEEMDYQGMVEYVRGQLMEDVEQCIFGKPDERVRARESLKNRAVAHAGAEHQAAVERVSTFIDHVIDMISSFYREGIDKSLLLVAAEITDEIGQIRSRMDDQQQELLSAIKEIKGTQECVDILSNLREQLRRRKGTGGRFYQLDVKVRLIPNLKTESRGSFTNDEMAVNPLYECLEASWNEECRPILLLADGGMGKSSAILCAWERFLMEQTVAVYIPLQEITEGTGVLEQHLAEQLGCSIDDACAQKERIVLFLDGFNEMKTKCVRDVVASVKKLCALSHLQLVISSRYDFRAAYGLMFMEGAALEALTNQQVDACFEEEQISQIRLQPYLYELLHNPMMLMLYREVESVMQQNRDVPWIEWRQQITASGDLLWNYYQAQCVNVLLNADIDGEEIINRIFVIHHILPVIAYDAMIAERFEITEEQLEENIERAFTQYRAQWGTGRSPEIKVICRQLDVEIAQQEIGVDACIRLLCKRMHFLADNHGTYAFLHQIHRDYMASLYLFRRLTKDETIPAEWQERTYDETIYQYLRGMTDHEWDSQGIATRILDGRRNADSCDSAIANTLDCWLPKECGVDVSRDLTGLDLREYRLSKHLMRRQEGIIDISCSQVAEYTFIDQVKHDRMVAMAFSSNSRYLAALSNNGILSLYDRETMFHHILKRVQLSEKPQLYFSVQDHLIFRNGTVGYCWNTELYDRCEEIDFADGGADSEDNTEVEDKAGTESEDFAAEIPDHARTMRTLLEQNHQLGTCQTFSCDYVWLATGNKDGLIEIWECETQNQVGSVRLGNSTATSAAFSTDGAICAVTSGSRLLQLWDMKQMRYQNVVYMPKAIRSMKFEDQDHAYLVSCVLVDGSCVAVDCSSVVGCGTTVGCGIAQPELISRTPVRQTFNMWEIEKRLGKIGIGKIDSSRFGNAIVLSEDGKMAFVWHHKVRKWTPCASVSGKLIDVAICQSDERFAAGYSDKRVTRDEISYYKGKRRARAHELENQKVIRIWHTDTGQLLIRLPTMNKSIRALKFFTNGIIIAGFATDGSILLWRLVNEWKYGKEIGRWDSVPTVIQNNSEIPLECVIAENTELISAYADGSIIRRRQNGSIVRELHTLPGADFTPVKMDNLRMDRKIGVFLDSYK